MQELAGKIAVVTGATRGIGREIALELARRGCDVAFNFVSSHGAAEALCQEIQAIGRRALAQQADVKDAEAVNAFFLAINKALGPIDFLVNNAGISRGKLVMSTRVEEWDEHLDTNLTGAFLCSKAVIVGMMKRRSGRIVNVSSVLAFKGLPGASAYAASKAGLLGLTCAMAREVGGRGITVNAVAPGFVETDMVSEIQDASREALIGQIPMGRFGTAADVAPVVAFLLGPGGAYITGQVLVVDGGLSS